LISGLIPMCIKFGTRRDNKSKTVHNYKTPIAHFIYKVGNMQIDAINSKIVFEYRESL
jgi:hypothetical protein